MNFNFYKNPAFQMTMIVTGCVIGGVALTLVWQDSGWGGKRWDLSKGSYETLAKALDGVQNQPAPTLDPLDAQFKLIAKKCKKNEKVVRLMGHLETIRVLTRYKAKDDVKITNDQQIILNQAFDSARSIINEKLGKK